MNKILLKIATFFILSISLNFAHAQEMYVTDRVILGVHQAADETSVLVSSLPSGTKVEILDSLANFSKIKLDSGIEGWIKTEFLIKDKPSILALGEVTTKLESATQELKKLKERATKRERDLQTREDQVANSKSTIKDLKKQLTESKAALANANTAKPETVAEPVVVAPDNSAELEAANLKIDELSKQIEELQTATIMDNVEQNEPSKAQLNSEIKKLLMRIKVAQANLNGEEIPSPEELAAIQPQMPLWYWVLLSTMIILGFVFGIFFIDYMHRKKHGGFRL
ncbi:hypothetical protein MNBD_GAMMA22-1183 [hydrothermal vent metagenome]|uniref:SH3b domain-containing protein n=1 Tax=hydrothermal vent metagenome TaxID=652676 RepID=A0A3B1AZ65_9ZZZZ